jgi:ATP-dependent Clp protease ATP-binding subunit ClpA
VAQRSQQADRVLDLAGKEAERFGHRYLGPEHVLQRALQLAGEQAHALGHREVRPEHLLLGVLEDAQQPADQVKGSRRHRRIIAHVGLLDGYRGAAGSLLRSLGVDLDELWEAVTAELGGVQR